jgi:hypothetical protein
VNNLNRDSTQGVGDDLFPDYILAFSLELKARVFIVELFLFGGVADELC